MLFARSGGSFQIFTYQLRYIPGYTAVENDVNQAEQAAQFQFDIKSPDDPNKRVYQVRHLSW